jgi:hypothetical protein
MMRSSVAFSRRPGAKDAATTTKSNTFQPDLKKSWGRVPKPTSRIVSSTTKTPRKTSLSVSSTPPASRSIES